MMTNIFWATIYNHSDRVDYIELAHLGGEKWSAVLGLDEFRFKSQHTDFLDVLTDALDFRRAQSPSQDTV